MRFTQRELAGIAGGDLTVVLRRWATSRVRQGTRVRTPVGLVEIVSIDEVDQSEMLEPDDFARGGFVDRAQMLAWADGMPGRLFRIEVRAAGPDPRIALRSDADLDEAQVEEVSRRLARMDRSAESPWTRPTLELIEARPETVSTELAEAMGLERQYFKQRVRRLKELGLTESLEVGYRLSPRGEAYLRATRPAT